MHQATQNPSESCSKNENEASTASDDDDVSLLSSSTTSSPPAFRLKIVGICGSTGSGKSFVSDLLVSKINSAFKDPIDDNAKLHAHRIDADALGHDVYAPGSAALKEIEAEFGKEIISNGMVDRPALGKIVFADRNQMSKLEHIVWPHIKNLLLKRLTDIQSSYDQDTAGALKPGSRIVLVDAAILLDTNWDADDLFDAVWVVKASAEVSVKRLMKRGKGLKEADARKRIEAQRSRRGIGNLEEEVRKGAVTAVIENNVESEESLWKEMKTVSMDPKCWKVDRCSTLDHQVLERK